MNTVLFGARMLRAIARGAGIIAMTVVLTPPAMIAVVLMGRCPAFLPRLWHRGACTLTGLRVTLHGDDDSAANTVLVANHVSYLDIMVIGGFTDTVFVAKGEVADWPVIGPLARLIGTVFVSRSRTQARAEHDRMRDIIRDNRCVCLFPEGTSSDGSMVLPFRSSLFDAVRESGATVQPLSIVWRDAERAYAWYGDMPLLPHLGGLLMRPGIAVDLVRHPAVSSAAFADRKTLAHFAEDAVRAGLGEPEVDALSAFPALPLIEDVWSRAA